MRNQFFAMFWLKSVFLVTSFCCKVFLCRIPVCLLRESTHRLVFAGLLENDIFWTHDEADGAADPNLRIGKNLELARTFSP